MNKLATLGGAAVVVIGAAALGGAWYTGSKLEPLLREQVDRVNEQAITALGGRDAAVVVTLDTFERHVFSSDVRYQVVLTSPDLNGGEPVAFGIAEHVDHGPFPWSRVKALKLLPVMASSTFELQNSRELQSWFELAKGVSPVTGEATIGYDQAMQTSLRVQPLQWDDARSKGELSGIEMQGEGTLNGKRMQANGTLSSLKATLHTEQGDVNIDLQGLAFNTGGLKGESGFYLGNSEVKLASATFQAPSKPAVTLNDFLGVGGLEESDGKLKGHTDYTVGGLSIAGKPVGSLQMRWAMDRFDAVATGDLVRVYQETLQPQAQAAAKAGVPFHPQLSPADQLQVQASALRLLAGNPHIALENLGVKTANGESHASLSLDLTKPQNLEQPAPALLQEMVQMLDFKLALSKLTVQDLATVQGQVQGQTDTAALARNAEGAGNLVATLATVQGLGRLEGNDILSDLHYENGMVSFNGQKMTVQEFVAFVYARLGQR